MDSSQRAKLAERYEGATDLPLSLLALAMIPLLVLPLVMRLDGNVESVFEQVDWTIWAIFAVDITVRTYLAEKRIQYLLRHWFDVLIVVLPFLRPLRIVRSARVLRLLRLARAMPFATRAGVVALRLLRRRGLQYVLLFELAAIFGFAGAVMAFERGHGGNIDDYGTAIWWAITTATTVGYGDTFPVSPQGRAIAIVLMILGISLFGWLTANVAAFLMEDGGDRPITTNDLMTKLESLERQIQALQEENNPLSGQENRIGAPPPTGSSLTRRGRRRG